jgi:hypothetical protein
VLTVNSHTASRTSSADEPKEGFLSFDVIKAYESKSKEAVACVQIIRLDGLDVDMTKENLNALPPAYQQQPTPRSEGMTTPPPAR